MKSICRRRIGYTIRISTSLVLTICGYVCMYLCMYVYSKGDLMIKREKSQPMIQRGTALSLPRANSHRWSRASSQDNADVEVSANFFLLYCLYDLASFSPFTICLFYLLIHLSTGLLLLKGYLTTTTIIYC